MFELYFDLLVKEIATLEGRPVGNILMNGNRGCLWKSVENSSKTTPDDFWFRVRRKKFGLCEYFHHE